MRVLVTGATGYVGGRLAPRLIEAGHQVRCLTREPRRLRDVPWADRVEVVGADLTRADQLTAALEGVEVAYYLVHSMGQRAEFEAADRQAAGNFAQAARAVEVRRIVYLGGPDPGGSHPGGAASAHLRSRAEVGRILLDSGVPTIVLRAAVIIGSGSASFEMLRYLSERLPVMVTPRWVGNRVQPIAIRDVLRYLVAAATVPGELNRAFDIGGPDVLTYAEMMQGYAAVAGLTHRVIIPTRFLSPWLSAHWVGAVTPVPNAIARPLVASLTYEAVAREHDIAALIPDPPGGLLGFTAAVRLALAKIRDDDVETSWANATLPDAPTDPLPSDPLPSGELSSGPLPSNLLPSNLLPSGALVSGPLASSRLSSGQPAAGRGSAAPMSAAPLPSDPAWAGGSLYHDDRSADVNAPVDRLWRVIEGVGGAHGWYSFPLAWSVRGWLDRLVGGVGLRRGRRDPNRLRVGEALDFWRVEEIRAGELLRLRAEMRLPGRAWLELRAEPAGPDRSHYAQRAIFVPRGLLGHAYWATVWPFHAVVFGEMARNIAHNAERASN